MSDNRTVATDALASLGTIIDDTAKRDAIHLAVIPAVAGQRLRFADHVELRDGLAYQAPDGEGVGIVDPFLTRWVRKGERFWLVIYPRTIQSLRHVWSHPAFPDEPVASAAESDDKEVPPAIATLRKIESEKWLRRFCDSNHADYSQVLSNAADADFYESMTLNTSDSGSLPEEFWTHVETVLGRTLAHHPEYFSCSC